jgi:hypothetical protein
LKKAAMNGGRDRLTAEALEFVGVSASSGSSRPLGGQDGWRQPNTAMFEIDSILSAEDSAMLQALMNAGNADRVEFMG